MAATDSTAAQFADETDTGGRFQRQTSVFRDCLWERPADGRLQLYVSLACPWASRIVLARSLKGLEQTLPMTVVDPLRDEHGWHFFADEPDPVNGYRYLAEAYLRTDPSFEGRVTVPTLYDRETDRVLNNESADQLRMLQVWSDDGPDLYPQALRAEIDAVNEQVYESVNNGVYRAGFATTQPAYEEAFDELFTTLDALDQRLADRRYLVGSQDITEADIRLFTTLVRFDSVYVGHFKCNRMRIADYPNLGPYLRDLYQHPGWAQTVDFDHIKRHYYLTHRSINGNGLVPKGPALDLDAPHGREALVA